MRDSITEVTPQKIVSVVVFPLAVALLSVIGFHYVLTGALAVVLVIFVAYQFSFFTVVLLLGVAVIPTTFAFIPSFVEDYSYIGAGLNAEDLIILSMLGAVIVKAFKLQNELYLRNVYRVFLLLGLWLLYQIVRNVTTYGLSATGEFRYRYLILVVLVYVSLFFDSSSERKRLAKFLIFSSVAVPILSFPVIGMLKGWSFGEEHRFMNSGTHLGLLYGMLFLYFGTKYGMFKVSRGLLRLLTFVTFVLIVLDSHRSVWLAAGVAFLVLWGLKEIKIGRSARSLFPLIVMGGILALYFSGFTSTVYDYVTTRGEAFIDYEQDHTAQWRVAIWVAALQKIAASPIAGEGFGGYWYFELPQLGEVVTVSPHSYYIQTLVKIGAAGLFLYLLVVVRLWKKLKAYLVLSGGKLYHEYSILLIATVVLVASHAYYFVYGLDYYTMVFLGLGMAALNAAGDY